MRFASAAALVLALCARPAVAEEWPVGSPPIRVAVGPVCPPLFYMDIEGNARGFVVDYLTEAAHRASAPIEFELVPDRRAFEALDPAHYPLALWLLADEPFPGYIRFERGFLTLHSTVFRRSQPHFETELEAADLGEVIAVRGSEAHQDLLDDGAVDVVTVPTVEEGVLLLSSGKHDTLFATDIYVLQAIRDLKIENVEIAPSTEMHMHHRFALLRAATRPDVEERISPALRTMRHDGTFDVMYGKWFGPFEEREVPLRVFNITLAAVVAAAILLGLVVVPLSRRRLRALLSWQGQALEESEARIAAIMAASPTGIFRLDLNGAVTFGNHEAGRITGIRERPVNLQRWLGAIHPDDRASVAAAWKSVREHNEGDHREYRFVHPNGEIVWVLDRGIPEHDSAGNIIGFVGTLTDITQLKHHQTSYQTHSKVLASMKEGVNTTDIDGKILYTNPAFDAMFGYAPGELIGQNVSALNHVSQREFDRHAETIKSALLTRGHWTGEFRNRHKDGTEFWTRARISRLEGAGEAFGVCVQEDITEAKRAQEALRESEEKFRSVAESAIVGIALYDGERFVFANDAMMHLVGYTPPELFGMTREQMIRLFCPHQDISQIVAALGALDSSGEYFGPAVLGDTQYYRKDGEERWAWVSIARIYADRPFPRMFMCVDTTERRLAQEALRESEEKFRRVAESALVGIAIHDETRYTFFNDAMQRLIGYHPDDFEGMTAEEEARETIWEGDIPRVMETFRRMDSDATSETEALEDVQLIHKDGTPRWATLFFSRLFPDRAYPRLTVSVDCTVRVHAKQALHESEEKFRSVAESAMVGIAVFDGDTYTFVNRAMLQLYGYDSPEEIASFARQDLTTLFFSETERDRVLCALEQLDRQHNSTQPVVLEDVGIRHKDGGSRWAYIMFSRLYPDRPFPRLTVCVDTTPRKVAEQSVAKHQDMLRRTQQMARIGGWEYTLGGHAMQCSDVVFQIFGFDPAQPVTWQMLLTCFSAEDRRMIEARGLQAVAEGTPFAFEAELTNLRGERVWVHTSAELVVENGQVVCIVGAVQDITNLKRVENSLRASEQRLRAIVDAEPECVKLVDRAGHLVDMNPAGLAVIEADSLSQVIGVDALGIVLPDHRALYRAALAEVFEGKTNVREFEIVGLKGSRRWMEQYAAPIWDTENVGQVKHMLAVARDVTARKQAEEALRRSESRLSLIFNTTSDMQVLLRVEPGRRFVIEEVNRAYIEYTGRPAAEIVGRERGDFLSGLGFTRAVIDAELSKYMQAVAEMRTISYEMPFDSPDGPVTLEMALEPVVGPDGRCTHVLWDGRDITARRRAETALEESKRTLAVLMSNLPGMAYRCQNNPDWKFEFVNEGCLALTGYTVEELSINRSVSFGRDVIHPHDQDIVWSKVQAGVNAKQPFEMVYRIRTATGQEKWVWEQGRGIYDADGKLRFLEGFIIDVSERVRADELARLSEDRLKEAQRIAKVGSWELDLITGEIVWSDEMYRILEVDKDTHAPTYGGFIEFVHPDDRHAVDAAYRDSVASKQPNEIIHRVRMPDGRIKWMHERYKTYYDSAGAATRSVGAMQDITERKLAEEERHAIEVKMQQAQRLESLAVLAGGIAHDFNNLLAGILGHADLAREDVPDSNPARESIEQIDVAARRAADLVHQMLAYAGKGNFVIRRLHLSELVREIAKLLEVTLSKKAVLKFELDDTVPAIEADAAQIQQVVMNLITNASDALDEEPGTITLRSGVVEYCADALHAYEPHEPQKPGTFVYLEVTDTGCGMDAATLNRIFDPFFTTKFTGRGLGLAATLGIIRGHGGGLRVTSRVGGGTTFRIIFPVAVDVVRQNGDVDRSGDVTVPSHSVGAGALLVVDDEPRVRDFLVRALQRFGHEVFSAADGQEALVLFGRNSARIDAVLLDITMPGIGGEEVLRQLHAQYPDLPVLLMSGFSEAETRQRLHHNGFTGFLQKPFSIEALRQAVDALFVRK